MFHLHRLQVRPPAVRPGPGRPPMRRPWSRSRAAARPATQARPRGPGRAIGPAAQAGPTRAPSAPRRVPCPGEGEPVANPGHVERRLAGLGRHDRQRAVRVVNLRPGPGPAIADVELAAFGAEGRQLRLATTLRQPPGTEPATVASSRRVEASATAATAASAAGRDPPGPGRDVVAVKQGGVRAADGEPGFRSTLTSSARLVAGPASRAARGPGGGPRRLAGRSPGDHLGQHRVVVRATTDPASTRHRGARPGSGPAS